MRIHFFLFKLHEKFVLLKKQHAEQKERLEEKKRQFDDEKKNFQMRRTSFDTAKSQLMGTLKTSKKK